VRGFTLLEVLVALVLVAVTLGALVRLSSLEARASADLRDRTLAQWVAANRLAEVRLGEGFPSTGRSRGETTMGTQRWLWEQDVQDTDEPTIRRIEVSVRRLRGERDAGEGVDASLVGFAVQR
jgi:general secretion pathway protein I